MTDEDKAGFSKQMQNDMDEHRKDIVNARNKIEQLNKSITWHEDCILRNFVTVTRYGLDVK